MSTVYAKLRNELDGALSKLVSEGFIPSEVDISTVVLERPKDITHGDFATNAAMVLAKPCKQNPRVIAEKIVRILDGSAELESAVVAGPGFINFQIKPAKFQKQIKDIITEGKTYGSSDLGSNKKVLVEFVSINPTGPIHVGHGRGAIFGDVLCRLLEKAGYDVDREYLVNDHGGQVWQLVSSVLMRYCELFGDKINHDDLGYVGEYIIDVASDLKKCDGDKWLTEARNGVTPELMEKLRAFCVDKMMNLIKIDLDLLDIHFDKFFSERAMFERGEVEKSITELREKGYVYEGILPPPKGKEINDYKPVELTLFKSKQFGDDEDRPLYKPDGSHTYFGADVAYHYDKINRGYSKLINVWGADHGGTVKRLKAAIAALTGKEDILHISLVQMVKLLRDGKPVKMSKRSGAFVTLNEVIDEVGTDAIRFWFSLRKLDSQLDFDLTKAVEKSKDNPVFYVQYASARMCSIYRQRDEMGIVEIPVEDADLSLLTTSHELELMHILCMYPLMIERAAESEEPHRIAFYASELAANFHSWYDSQRFLDKNNLELTHARLTLVKASQMVLINVLDILGVSAPKKM